MIGSSAATDESEGGKPVDVVGTFGVQPTTNMAAGRAKPIVSMRREPTDAWLPVTVVAAVGTTTAVGLAVFGLPGVDLHGPLHFLGIMDPLCGGTRAIRLATQGHWAQSWEYNPVGIPVLVVFVTLIGRAAFGLVTHHWYTLRFGWTRRRAWIALVVLLAVTVALEARQQSLATLLISRT